MCLSASLLEVVFQEDGRRGEGGGGCEVEGRGCAASLGLAPWASSARLRSSKCTNKEHGSMSIRFTAEHNKVSGILTLLLVQSVKVGLPHKHLQSE